MNFLKLFVLIAVLGAARSEARHFTTYGRGEARDYYGNRYAACDQAQRAAIYYAASACQSRHGRVVSSAVSACGCAYQFVYGRHTAACAADARVACEMSYGGGGGGGYPGYPDYPGYGRPRDPGYGYPRDPGHGHPRHPGHGHRP